MIIRKVRKYKTEQRVENVKVSEDKMLNQRFVQMINVVRAIVLMVLLRAPSLSAGELSGRVMDTVTGKPAADVHVSIQATKQSLSGRKSKGELRETRTDADGKYQFSALSSFAYNIWADAADRTCSALNSIQVVDGEITAVDDLQLVEGNWIEGRLLTLRGEPLSHDPQTGERLRVGLNGPARPLSGASLESAPIDDDGRFRLRVTVGRNFIRLLTPELWEQTWKKEKYERGIDIEDSRPLTVNFRILDQQPKRRPPPPRPSRDPVNLPVPVAAERDCAETIRDLGGWYRIDDDRRVVEINMVYDQGQRALWEGLVK